MADGSPVPQLTRPWPFRRARWGAVLLAALLAAGCGSKIDQAAATRIATDFLRSGEPSGTTVQNVTVRSVHEQANAWQVELDAQVVVPAANGGTSTPIHELIDVDKDSGVATQAAQG